MTTVTANFPGAAFPPETKVAFTDKNGTTFNGTVIELSPRRAEVATQDGTHWKVPYPLLTVTQLAEKPAMTLQEIETLAKQLIRKHEKESGLQPGWQFRFDLAASRGGLQVHRKTYHTLCNLLLERLESRNRGHNPPRNRTCHCRTRARARCRMGRNRIPYRLHRHPMPLRRSYAPEMAWAVWMRRTMGTSSSDTTQHRRRMFGVRSGNRLETNNRIGV